MTETTRLDTIYTADEAAARLRLTKREVIKLARKHGACSRAGRNYLISEADLLAIWQAMREMPVARSVIPSSAGSAGPSYSSALNELKWMSYTPPTSVDRRVLSILRWLDGQKEPKSYKEIGRAGPRTIDLLLKKGFVQQFGVNGEGFQRVKITPEGRDQIKIFDRWKKKNAERRQLSGR